MESDQHTAGTVFFVVALLTVVVVLVDERMIRAALAFVPAMMLAQRALSAADGGTGRAHPQSSGSDRREDGVARHHLDRFLKQFREFYTTCHLLGAGTIPPEEALQRTSRLEGDLNRLMAEVTSAAQTGTSEG